VFRRILILNKQLKTIQNNKLMKKTLLLITLAAISLVASAQLKVTSDGKVKIASNLNNTNFNLLVGNTSFGSSRSNVGISGSTTGMTDKRNIGVIGTINAPSGFTDETNMGVFGVVSPISRQKLWLVRHAWICRR
jgi:hypothetical protein